MAQVIFTMLLLMNNSFRERLMYSLFNHNVLSTHELSHFVWQNPYGGGVKCHFCYMYASNCVNKNKDDL